MRLPTLIQYIPHIVLDIVLAVVLLALLAMSLIDLPAVVHATTIVLIGGGVLLAAIVRVIGHARRGSIR